MNEIDKIVRSGLKYLWDEREEKIDDGGYYHFTFVS